MKAGASRRKTVDMLLSKGNAMLGIETALHRIMKPSWFADLLNAF